VLPHEFEAEVAELKASRRSPAVPPAATPAPLIDPPAVARIQFETERRVRHTEARGSHGALRRRVRKS